MTNNINFYAKEVTTIANCFDLSLVNGTKICFTDHMNNIKIDNNIYYSNHNIEISAVSKELGLSPDNLTINGILDHNIVKLDDILLGNYDYAEFSLFQVDYNNPNQDSILLQRGFLGKIEIIGNQFIANINSLEIHTNQKISSVYSPNCRACLGDSKCKIKLEDYYYKVNIISWIDNKSFVIEPIENLEFGHFNYGKAIFSNSENVIQKSISLHNSNKIVLSSTVLHEFEEVILVSGCDKKFETCCNKFNNAINFRGEPHIPGLDKLFGG